MKKNMARGLALILTLSILFSFMTSAMAAESAPDFALGSPEYSEYYTEDGTFVEAAFFTENGAYAAVIKRTYEDGSYTVEAINGYRSTLFEGTAAVTAERADAQTVGSRSSEFPRYTPYWYAGDEEYSIVGTALTASVIAAAIVAATGMGLPAAMTVASVVYSALGTNVNQNLYFTTERYYATLENGPGLPTIWYNKFVTYTYADSNRTRLIDGPTTEIIESGHPM